MHTFYDTVKPQRVRITDDGYLVADAPVARTGVQMYRGSEVGRPDMPFVRVYRPPEEVFDEASMHSYAFRPMTNDHPTVGLVDATSWKDVAIGTTGGEVTRDGETIRVSLVMMDAASIKLYQGGKRELSMGYTAEIDFCDSEQTTPDGTMKYDAVQRNLRMNHLALVSKGRAGNAKIGDGHTPNPTVPANEGGQIMAETTKVVVDGLTIETTTQGAEVIGKLQRSLADADAKLATTDAAHAKALAAKDTELATKDAEIEKLKGQITSDADIDALVTKRAALVTTAKSLHDADYSGKSELQIKTAVVAAKFGDEAVKDKSEAYINARYDVLCEDAAAGNSRVADPVRSALGDASKAPGVVVDADKAYADNISYLQNAYKGEAQK